MSAEPLALVPVRDGEIGAAGIETVAAVASAVDGGGVPLLVGRTLGPAAAELAGIVSDVRVAECSSLPAGRIAAALAPQMDGRPYVLVPGTPDGRDLGARLAAELGRPYVGTALAVGPGFAVVPRHGGELMARLSLDGPFVAGLQPGITSVSRSGSDLVSTTPLDLGLEVAAGVGPPEAVTVRIEGPDATTMDLAEAPRIVGGGAGMMGTDDTADHFEILVRVGAALGASMGATRVVTDAGWVPHSRQIGTTGVVVDPDLYLAFGISGAVQHTAGLGRPDHVISVNTDAHCPMMAMADLAVVADADRTLAELDRLLGPVTG